MKESTCAALVHNNTRCQRYAQCARAVSWFDDRRAAFNLCSGGRPGKFDYFKPVAADNTIQPPRPQLRQASLF